MIPTETEAAARPAVGTAPKRIPYIADPDLVAAAKVAMTLGKALLLTGEPGTGKTTFAQHVADTLAPAHFDLPQPLRLFDFATKSGSVATDLFYRFDTLRRFHASHDTSMSRANRDYLSFEALGKAILFTLPWSEIEDLVPKETDHPGVKRSVVLIDEIDKAPRDFPNDILTEIDKHAFRIPEIQTQDAGLAKVREVQADPQFRPVIILTSNSEKNLPDAFLRRCVFHHIEFPKDEKKLKEHLARVIEANIAEATGPLVEEALDIFYKLRQQRDIDKRPATAELVDWVEMLRQEARSQGRDPDRCTLRELGEQPVRGTLALLAKTRRDQPLAQSVVKTFFGA